MCLSLDRTVWSIRRYSFYLRGQLSPGKSWLPLNLDRIQRPETLESPHKYRIFGGFLEKVLDGKQGEAARALLVWKNFYYGSRCKKVVKNYKLSWHAANSPLSLHPEIYDDLKSLVQFTKEVSEAMNKWKKEQSVTKPK